MKRGAYAFIYGSAGSLLFILERFTKLYALAHYEIPQQINSFLVCDLTLNRGISWGLFHSTTTPLFVAISLLIAFITGAIAYTGIVRFWEGHFVIGELLVVCGSVSNLIDRIVYNGVIDFIELSYNGYTWPVFNGADVCIVVGIFLMVVEHYKS